MVNTSTNSAVLDTTVVVKSLLKPPSYLPEHILRRENETHRKCRVLMTLLRSSEYIVYFPRAGLVEVAAVLRRGGVNRDTVKRVIQAIGNTFVIVREDHIFAKALEIALLESPSGFDTYFIALAALTGATLVTDDEPMAVHAKRLGLDVILIREVSLDELKKKLGMA